METSLESASKSLHRIANRLRSLAGLLLCTCLCGAPWTSASLSAQAPPVVAPGSRVRVTVPSLGIAGAAGRVGAATDDSLRVLFDNPRRDVAVARSSVTALDVSVDRQRNTLKGLGLGAIIGTGGGVLLGFASGDDPSGFLSFTAEEKAVIFGVFFGSVGSVLGLVAGALTWREVWQPVAPMATRVPNVSVVPFTTERGTRVHVGFSLPAR